MAIWLTPLNFDFPTTLAMADQVRIGLPLMLLAVPATFFLGGILSERSSPRETPSDR